MLHLLIPHPCNGYYKLQQAGTGPAPGSLQASDPQRTCGIGFGGVFDSFLKLALNFWVAQTLPT